MIRVPVEAAKNTRNAAAGKLFEALAVKTKNTAGLETINFDNSAVCLLGSGNDDIFLKCVYIFITNGKNILTHG